MQANHTLPTLPMHLALTLLYTLSWPTALANANAGSLPLRKPLARKLHQKKLRENLHREAKSRTSDFLRAIHRYTETPYERSMQEPPCIWQKGSSRLLDYGQDANASTVMIFVPSLINRYYILDLEKERSLLRYLATQGIYPLVLDWGMPGEMEADFRVEDYISEILLPAIDFIHQTTGMAVTLGGYCMGGVLSVAAAQLRPKKVEKLALFATPWDFYCKEFTPFILDTMWQEKLSKILSEGQNLPAEIIQALFYLTDPFVFEEKFRRFLSLDSESRAAKDFIALEHWVNDGVPMTSQVAKDCLIGWAQRNELASGEWRVTGKKIDPKKLSQPVFIAIPKQDHVVPYDCAMALARTLPHATIIHPGSGHVGMIVGSRAKSECWNPLVEWLNEA
jgi:polyhydroxyalkanoate synthase